MNNGINVFERRKKLLQNGILNFASRLSQLSVVALYTKFTLGEKPTF